MEKMQQEQTQNRVLVIGLDGGTFEILNPLVEQGYMPHLGRLLEMSAWGSLESTIPPFTATAWSSFATGVNPGKHGILNFAQLDRYNYEIDSTRFVDSRILPTAIWEEMSRAGRSVGILHVPLTYPVRPVNGTMISGMLTPPGSANSFFPSQLKTDFVEEYRFDVNFVREGEAFRVADFPTKEKMLEEIGAVMDLHLETSYHRLKQDNPDFFMTVITATDRLGHFFWEELGDIVDKRPFTALHYRLLDLFERLDVGIGQLIRLRQAESDYIMLMSDHGFGPSQTGYVNLNVLLRQHGFLSERQDAALGDLEYWRVKLGQNRFLKRLVQAVMPQRMQQRTTELARQTSKSEMLDREKTQAFVEPIYFHVCGISLNVVGERRDGNIFPGPEYEAIRDQIIRIVQESTDPKTGQPLVERVSKREVLFHGPHLSKFPDIIVELKPNYVPGASLASRDLVEPYHSFRAGDHRSNGIFALAGPEIRPLGDLSGLDLLDLPATILYLLDLPIPSYYDSQVMTDLFDPAYVEAHPIDTVEASIEFPHLPSEMGHMDESGDEAVEERLRGLGYIE